MTLGVAAVAVEDTFARQIAAERRVVVVGDHDRLVTLRVHHRHREVETVSPAQPGGHSEVAVASRQLDL